MAVIGIDLGTTNSAGAYYDGKDVRTIRSQRPDALVPSVVAFRKRRAGGATGEGELLVGQNALDYAPRDPENAILSIKRLMGRSYGEPKVEEVRGRVNYAIVASGDEHDPGVRVRLGEKLYRPEDISACILRQIKEDAEKALGEKVTHAVITVPAYFEERQRAATLRAGLQAGLLVKKIIDEPSAAAVAYGFTVSKGERKRLLVFDLGGGTFDVSIIATVMDPEGRNHFEVLEIRGDNWLGGDDFDRLIVGEILQWVKENHEGADPTGDRVFHFLAKQAAERAKITLSSGQETEISLPGAFKTPQKLIDVDFTITRDRFEELIRPRVDGCMRLVREALLNQGLEPEDIDVVLLVGGSTLVPLVYEAVRDCFGAEKVQQKENPFHSVALGAAILAATLQGVQCPKCGKVNDDTAPLCEACQESLAAAAPVGGATITEPTAMDFGISAVRGDERDAFEVIIPKGTIYPLLEPKSKQFVTTADDLIRIPVYEGVQNLASKNEHQGDIVLDQKDFADAGARAAAGTTVTVKMNFTRDRELIVSVAVHGTALVKSMKLRRDQPRPVPVGDPASDGRKRDELRQTIGLAENFRGRYIMYMDAREQRRLEEAIVRAITAVDSGSPQTMQESLQGLMMALDSCGVASLLFMAEQVQSGASPDRARKLGDALQQLKHAWGEGNAARVSQLTSILRAVIAAELTTRQAQQAVPGQREFGGKLKVMGS